MRTIAEQIVELELAYEAICDRGYRDLSTGRVFPLDARGRAHLASEALAATIVLGLPGLHGIGWRADYSFPDSRGELVPFSAEGMFRLAASARAYYAWIWHGYAATLRDIHAGLIRGDVGEAWLAWCDEHPWKS